MQSQQEYETVVDYNLYSRSQKMVLQILPLFTAPLSAIGSGLIMYTIAKHRPREIRTFQRFMLGMSVTDFVSSVGMIILGHWAVPKGTEFVIGARGNDTTCRVSYFFANLLFASMLYSAFLALYFMLVVRFHWPRQRIARFVEPFVHYLAMANIIGASTTEIVKKTVHPMYVLPGFCWPINDPLGCTADDDPETKCSIPESSGAGQGLIFFLFAMITVCMALILSQVRSTEQYVERYEVGEAAAHREHTKMIAKEALLYIGTFFLVFFPVTVIMSLSDKPDSTSRNRALYFAFAFLLKLLTPLQGFFNAMIFLRGGLMALVQRQGEGQYTLDLFVAYLNASENFSQRDQSTSSAEQVVHPSPAPQATPTSDLREGPLETGRH